MKKPTWLVNVRCTPISKVLYVEFLYGMKHSGSTGWFVDDCWVWTPDHPLRYLRDWKNRFHTWDADHSLIKSNLDFEDSRSKAIERFKSFGTITMIELLEHPDFPTPLDFVITHPDFPI